MELQVRVAYETAEMLEQLKEYYERKSGVKYSKGEVLSRAILDTYDLWDEIEWTNLKVEIEEREVAPGALRPKFQVSVDIEDKIRELKKIITAYLELNKLITLGATFKYVFKLALYQIQSSDTPSVEKILFQTMKEFSDSEYSKETINAINDFVDEIMLKLEENEVI